MPDVYGVWHMIRKLPDYTAEEQEDMVDTLSSSWSAGVALYVAMQALGHADKRHSCFPLRIETGAAEAVLRELDLNEDTARRLVTTYGSARQSDGRAPAIVTFIRQFIPHATGRNARYR